MLKELTHVRFMQQERFDQLKAGVTTLFEETVPAVPRNKGLYRSEESVQNADGEKKRSIIDIPGRHHSDGSIARAFFEERRGTGVNFGSRILFFDQAMAIELAIKVLDIWIANCIEQVNFVGYGSAGHDLGRLFRESFGAYETRGMTADYSSAVRLKDFLVLVQPVQQEVVQINALYESLRQKTQLTFLDDQLIAYQAFCCLVEGQKLPGFKMVKQT